MQPFLPSASEKVEPSFIREILKVACQPEIISRRRPAQPLFCSWSRPSSKRTGDELREQEPPRCNTPPPRVLPCCASSIADRYLSRHGTAVNPDNILITSGSSRRWILLSKVLVNEGQDPQSSEEPGYLAPSRRSPSINRILKPITLAEEGLDLAALDALLEQGSSARLLYGVPNFQNPERVYPAAAPTGKPLAERLARHDPLDGGR